MNTPIKQDEINKAVWQACDTFRGVVDPSIYKDYVLTMLFLKYISDVWQDHYDEYQKEHGDAPELIKELLKNERFVLPPEANFWHLHQHRHEEPRQLRQGRPASSSANWTTEGPGHGRNKPTDRR